MKKSLLLIGGIAILILTAVFFGNTNPTPKAGLSSTNNPKKTAANDQSISLSADLAIRPNQQTSQNDLDLIYTPNGNQDISAITLRLTFIIDQINLVDSSKPFELDTKLKTAGFTNHINKLNCLESSPCQLDVALIKLDPNKWNIGESTSLGSIVFKDNFDTSNLNIQIDQKETKALTPAGESITITLQK